MAEHTLQSVAFPVLDDSQIGQVSGCIKVAPKHYPDGERLISVGDRAMKFFIVKSGKIEILDYSGDEPRIIVTHGPGQFTGDVSHLTGMPAVFTAIARGECEVYEISQASLREVLNQCVHRAAAATTRIARFHGSPRDRVAILSRHVSGSRFSDA